MKIDGLELPSELIWTDEFEWSLLRSVSKRTIQGKNIVQDTVLPDESGRAVTLASDNAWATRDVVQQLLALSSNQGQTFDLTFNDDSVIKVRFRNWEPPVVLASPLVGTAWPDSTTIYILTLKLAVV